MAGKSSTERTETECTIARYGYAKGTYNVHKNIGISKHEKHLRPLSSGTKPFITSEFKGSSTYGERYTFFLFWLFFICAPTPTPSRATPAQGLREQAKVTFLLRTARLNSTDFFKISKILRALPVRDVTCTL